MIVAASEDAYLIFNYFITFLKASQVVGLVVLEDDITK